MPTRREAWTFSRLDAEGARAVHEHCNIAHSDTCPIEAARAAHEQQLAAVRIVPVIATSWAVTIAVGVTFPGWVLYAPNGTFDVWVLFAMASAAATFFGVRMVIEDHRALPRNLDLMLRSEPCDPWEFASRWPGRKPWFSGLRSPIRTSPAVLVAAIAGGGAVLIVTGSGLVAVLVAGWLVYTLPLIWRHTGRTG